MKECRGTLCTVGESKQKPEHHDPATMYTPLIPQNQPPIPNVIVQEFMKSVEVG